MRFEIPFQEQIARKQAVLLFDLSWKKLSKEAVKSTYYSLVFILFGILVKYIDGDVGYIFIACGVYLFFQCARFYFGYKKTKKVYFKTIDETIANYVANNSISIWEFLDEWFYYADFKLDLKLKWEGIKNYKVIDNTLILEIKDTIIANFILDKGEIGNHDFEKIILFIESKIKTDGTL